MGNCCGRHKQHIPRKLRRTRSKVLQCSNASRPIGISKFPSDTVSQTGQKVEHVSKPQQTESQENCSKPIIIDYDLSVINRARNMSLDEIKFMEVVSKLTIIKLKQIEPRAAAKVIREQLRICNIHENNVELEACINELETTAIYNITTGNFKIFKILIKQNSTIQHLHVAYHLFKVDSITMCNFIFVGAAEKQDDIDAKYLAISSAIRGGLAFLFFPLAAAVTVIDLVKAGVAYTFNESDGQRVDSCAAILKILECYHLIRFLPDSRIELLLD